MTKAKKTKKKTRKQFESIYEEDDDLTSPGIEIHTNPMIPKLVPLPDAHDRREAPRYLVDFEVVIFCQGRSFRTKTVNVSLIGVLLADKIPVSFVDQILDIVMIRRNGESREYYLVRGKALGSPFRSPRIAFTQIHEVQFKKLEALFNTAERAYGDE